MEKCKKMSEKKTLKDFRDMRRTFKKAGQLASLSKKEEKAQKEKLISMSLLVYCNPGCKGTIYSDDPKWLTHLKKEYQKKVNNKELTSKNAKGALSVVSDYRKTLVKEAGSTLLNKNSFYRKIRQGNLFPFTSKNTKKVQSPASYKKTMKSRGALSGCYDTFFLSK